MNVCTLSAGAYTASLYVIVNTVKEGGRVPLTLTSLANLSILMECPQESGRCHSVCTGTLYLQLLRASSLPYHFKDDIGQVCIRHERGKARAVDAHHFRFRQQEQARCRTQATQRDSLCNNISALWIFFCNFLLLHYKKKLYRNGILQCPVPYLVPKYVKIFGDRRSLNYMGLVDI